MKLYSSLNRPDQPWSTLCHLFNESWGSFPVVMLPKCEVDHSPSSSADVNERSYTSIPYMCHHVMDMQHISVLLITNTDGRILHETTLLTNSYFMLKSDLS